MATCLESALLNLQHIWDEIGICEEQRRERTDVVLLHLTNLLEEMVKEEQALKTNLMRNVETFGQDLLKLCKELALPPHEVTCLSRHSDSEIIIPLHNVRHSVILPRNFCYM